MDYLQAVAYLESLAPTILDPGLERMDAFSQEKGFHDFDFASVHIGGTNGKGSCVAMVDSILRAAGLASGRYTGPHLLRFNERFHINGKPISDDDFARIATTLRKQSEDFGRRHKNFGALTWFEFLTAMAFAYFGENKVDIGVFEVGLGGRWDATNVLRAPLVSAITTVDLDHTHILGTTVSAIAVEKAGIIKAGCPVVTGVNNEGLDVIRQRAKHLNAPLIICRLGKNPLEIEGELPGDQRKALEQLKFDRYLPSLKMSGEHQELNAMISLTIIALLEVKLKRELLKFAQNGLSNVYWPGRSQYLPELHILLDGAHNAAGARALRKTLEDLESATDTGEATGTGTGTGRRGRRLFVLSFFKTKNVPELLNALVKKGDLVFVSEAQGERAVFGAQDVVSHLGARGVAAVALTTIARALQAALTRRVQNDLIIATGSFATVKECMVALGWKNVEDGAPNSPVRSKMQKTGCSTGTSIDN